MNSRRKFLQQGSLAATALLLSGGTKSFAGSSFFFGSDDNNLVILHSHLPASGDQFIFSDGAHIKNVLAAEKRKFNNLLLVDDTTNDMPYRIVIKGNIRTGIINSSYQEGMSMDEINQLARILKENKKCNIVICVSELGYKNKNSVDDYTLASSSENIDIILGNTTTPAHLPSIVLNKNQHEVLINHCTEDAVAIGRISLRFDKKGAKCGMSYSNMIYRENKEEWKNFSLS